MKTNKKAEESAKIYAQGVKDGFNAGLNKAIEILNASSDEFHVNKKYSLLGKVALTVFVSKVIVLLTNYLNTEEKQ